MKARVSRRLLPPAFCLLLFSQAAAAVTASFTPQQPAVGDKITLRFDRAPVVLDRGEFELVEQTRERIVIRTFSPKPLVLSGNAGGVAFQGLTIPMKSVLLPNDDLKPAPLVPPRADAEPMLPQIAIAATALLAFVSWLALWLRARALRRSQFVAPPITPQALFRERVSAMRGTKAWGPLADALRAYLDATTMLSADLTTTELLALTPDPVIARILRQGDLAKFSPWGAAAEINFDDAVERALAMAPERDEERAA